MMKRELHVKRTVMKPRHLLFIFAFQLITPVSFSQISNERITGSWTGLIRESASEIRLVFNISVSPADTLMATLDIPGQAVEGLKLGKVTINDTLYSIDAPLLKGNYIGSFSNDTLVKGIWKQGGKDYNVDLSKLAVPYLINRPQEPKPPFPYKSEDITFRNTIENFDLAGTLTIPEGLGPFPAVILITGSGSQDRNETIFNHKPFFVISDFLTRNGIAVLRFDDRGTGSSKGNKGNATSEMLAGDTESALKYLMTRPEIDTKNIGLAGHSEGGLIAAIAASQNDNVSFVISLAGTGVSGYDINLKQIADLSLASGIDTATVTKNLKNQKQLLSMLLAEPDQKKLFKEAIEWYGTELESQGVGPDKRKEEMTAFAKAISTANNAWFRYFLATNPKTFWQKVKCPVLALNGEKDLQVNYTMNLNGIREGLRQGGNKKVTTKSLPGLNHLFQHCSTGLPSEYGSIEETFSPGVLEIMVEWINETEKKNR